MSDREFLPGRARIGAARWSRRRAWRAVAVLLSVIALYTWAVDAVLARRLAREMNRLQARGEPVTWEAISPEVAPERNAATLYQQAEAAVRWPSDLLGVVSTREMQDPGIVREHRDAVDRVLAMNRPALDLLAEAAARPEARWAPQVARPPAATRPASAAAGDREPAYLGCAALIGAAQDGDIHQSIHWTRAVLRYGEALASEKPGVASFLQGNMVQNLALRALEGALPDWTFTESAAGGERAEARQLIADLLDETNLRRQCRMAYAAERLSVLDSLRPLNWQQYGDVVNPAAAAPVTTRVIATLTFPLRSPWIHADELQVLQELGGFVAACDAPDYVEALDGRPVAIELRAGVARPWSNLWNRPELPLSRMYMTEATRRMAAVAIAIRLYAADHGGRPKQLGDLVPAYIAAIPFDPFTRGAELRYRTSDSPLRLYSVSRDGQDDGGALQRRRRGWRDPWTQGDLTFLLEPAPQVAAPRIGGG